MAKSNNCSVCEKALERGITVDTSHSKTYWAEELGVSEASVRRHFKHGEGVHVRSVTPRSDTAYPEGLPIQQARPVKVVRTDLPTTKFAFSLGGEWRTAVATADHQFGYRYDEPFHDDKAIGIASRIIEIEQPDQVLYCGDFLDLPSQSRWEPEPGSEGTTQRAIDRGHELLAIDRDLSMRSVMVLIEGNHDRRMEKFVLSRTMANFGLRRANDPKSWPVMSIPNLLRLDELRVEYIDAYPAGAWWVNENLRAIHGDKVRSGGSTASAYANTTPHISTIFGHTHRAEVQSKTVLGPGNSKIRSMSINPGAMCRIDGTVPSFHGATGIHGAAALRWEDWQNGLAVIRYKDTGEFFVNLVQIEDGFTVYEGQEIGV